MDIDWWNPPVDQWNVDGQYSFDVLNLAKVHPILSGNKYYKLYGFLALYDQDNYNGLASMGGAYSNHLHATAYYCYLHNIPFTAFIRSPKSELEDTSTIRDLKSWNTNIIPLSAGDFRALRNSQDYQSFASFENQNILWIPEGGNGTASKIGVQKVMKNFIDGYDAIWINVGTGATLAAILSMDIMQKIHFYAVAPFKKIEEQIQFLQKENSHQYPLMVFSDPWHLGFGKITPEIQQYVQAFENEHHIVLDEVYTARLFKSIENHISKNEYPHERTLIIHGGGLQGKR